MSDLFGFSEPPKEFVDIRNQRDSVAEEKAQLCAVLNRLCRSVPPQINATSVNRVRQFMREREAALKVLKSSKSSRQQLASAISAMQQFEAEG